MKKLLMLSCLFALPLQAQLSWRQTIGVACLVGAGGLCLAYPETVKKGLDDATTYTKKNPGKVILSLGSLGVVLLANGQVIFDLERAARLGRSVQKLFTS